MKYTLRDADGFYNDLNKTFSIPKDWVTFYDLDNSSNECIGGPTFHPGPGRNPAGRRSVSDPSSASLAAHRLEKRCERIGLCFYGLPKGKDNFAVPNPKDAITKAMPKMKELQIQLYARQIQLALGDYNGSVSDIGQALSLPVFMMAESIEQMTAAKAEGQNIKNKRDLDFLLEMLGVVFMFIPFLDELAPELLLFEGMATGLAFLGNTALGIKDIVEHPENAFMDILGIVMDGAFSKTGKGYKDAADARRGINDVLIEKSGKTIKQLDNKLQGVLEKACAK